MTKQRAFTVEIPLKTGRRLIQLGRSMVNGVRLVFMFLTYKALNLFQTVLELVKAFKCVCVVFSVCLR